MKQQFFPVEVRPVEYKCPQCGEAKLSSVDINEWTYPEWYCTVCRFHGPIDKWKLPGPDEKKKRTVTLYRYTWDTGGCIFQTEWKNFPAELYLGRSESWRLLKTESKNVEIEGE
jgi:predicted RNA-binding Zn-ribbon protein involved in translation (DUF1610 family)